MENALGNHLRIPLVAVIAIALVSGVCASGAQERAAEGRSSAAVPSRNVALARGTAEVLRYETEIGTVVVGDADVAAASVAQSDALVLTGLAEGNTNVIVLDGDGADMDRITLRVSAPGRRVELWHGLERDVRSCERFCPPADSADAAAGGAGTVDSAASP